MAHLGKAHFFLIFNQKFKIDKGNIKNDKHD
jgi:hypothetical protein